MNVLLLKASFKNEQVKTFDLHQEDDDIIRSSQSQILLKIVVLLESLLNEVAGLHACNFIEKRPLDSCFPVWTLRKF